MASKMATKSMHGTSLGFYTPPEASRIAQVPQWTVNSWRRHGIVIPSIKWIDERNKVHIGHTFETVVFLRLIRMLRDKGIPLFEAVKAVKSLRERFGLPSIKWADVKIFVDQKDVYVHDGRDAWETTVATKRHQKVAEFLFGKEFELLRLRADALLIPSQFMEYVEIDLKIHNGLPIILGTSLPTNLVHRLGQRGHKYDEIHEMYPFIPINKIVGVEEYEAFLDKASRN